MHKQSPYSKVVSSALRIESAAKSIKMITDNTPMPEPSRNVFIYSMCLLKYCGCKNCTLCPKATYEFTTLINNQIKRNLFHLTGFAMKASATK